jgi:RNA polymerase sigma factor (sigma-70 family)
MTLPTRQSPGADDPRAAAADAAFRRYLRSGDPAAIADLFDLAAGDLHRTALHLVGDDATAHDLVQTTFLAAIAQQGFHERGFDERRPVLPWLAGILRNQAALVHRRRARRLDRERLGAEPSEDPAQRAIERELAGEVELALARLPEPYQPVVRLHVLHGLDAGAIAASLRRPGGTVRTQLMRGLALLRELLPVGIAGVVAGLLPSTGRAAVRAQVLAAAGRGAARATAALASSARPRFVWLSLAAAAAGVAVLCWPRGDDAAAPAAAVASASAPSAPAPSAPATPDVASALTREPAVLPTAPTFELRGVVTGTVLDRDGAPVAGADVLLWPQERPVMAGAGFTPPPAATVQTAADGTFAIRGSGPQCYLLARTADAISEHGIAGVLDGRDRVEGFELRLQPLVELRGRLLDADARPVPDFAFGTYRGGTRSPADQLAIPGFRLCELPYVDTRTDRDGRFTARVAAHEPYTWEVQHPEHPMLRVEHRAADGELLLRLERGAELHGVVWTWQGTAAAGAEVALMDWPVRRAVCDGAGRFHLRGALLRDGLWLQATFPGAALLCQPVRGAEAPIEVRLEPAKALAGRVVDGDGRPLAGCELRVVGDRTIDTGARHIGEAETWEFVAGRSRATTAADGAFHFDCLYDGLFAIEWKVDGGDFQPLTQVRSGCQQLELRAVDRSVRFTGSLRDALTGSPIEAAKVTVWHADSGKTRELAAPGGAFAFGDVAPGVVRLTFAAPGYADGEVRARSYAPGALSLAVALDPARSLEVAVRRAGKPARATVRAHLGDGEWLMLPEGSGTSNRRDVFGGHVRLERLPARPVTVVVASGGEPDVALTVDLLRPRVEPLVFELSALAPPMVFDLLAMWCTKDADPATWAGPIDREWALRLRSNPAVSLPTGNVTVTFTDDAGKRLATGTIKPLAKTATDEAGAPKFDVWITYGDGTGQGSTTAWPWLPVRVGGSAIVVRAEADGRAVVTRRLLPGDLAGEKPTFALFLPPR